MRSLICILTLFLVGSTHAFVVPRQTVSLSRGVDVDDTALSSQQHSKPPTAATVKAMSSSTALNVVGGTAVASSIALPKLSTMIATTVTPTLLGFYKYEYAVSYAYGAGTSITAALILRSLLSSAVSTSTSTPLASLAQLHAAAIVFYGVRLNLYLLYREIFLERFRKMRERIEEKRTKGNIGAVKNILSRVPFILSCSFLYLGLVYPAFISAEVSYSIGAITTNYSTMLYKVLVGLTWFGFGLGALGDFNKSLIKKLKGEDHLVTGGIFSVFRHPNYTGEMIGWTASFLASIASIFALPGASRIKVLKSLTFPLITSMTSVMGILFVLLAATTGLESRQKEKYGEKTEYVEWIKKSWKGFSLAKKE